MIIILLISSWGHMVFKRGKISLFQEKDVLQKRVVSQRHLRQRVYKHTQEIKEFSADLAKYIHKQLHTVFRKFEAYKGIFVTALYRQRGRMSRRFVHSGMAGLAALGVAIAPVIAQEFPGRYVDPWELKSPSSVLAVATQADSIQTVVSDKVRDGISEYTVKDGDTVGSIAEKFGISTDTVLWQNNLTATSKIKAGQVLEILPVTGIAHKVVKGDTIYSIAKKYDVDAQVIVNYPFNTYTNDETFELAVGQLIIVPEGVRPNIVQTSPRIKRITPDAGTVVASGQFVWPTNGRITQNFVSYHPGTDIANKSAPNVLAADSGRVIVAGWPDNYGYGLRVIIDHGNGYKTLYAHLQSIYVSAGQSVARGDAIGKMGSSGRSTGTHLHFEVSFNNQRLNPLSVLQ